MRAKNYSNVLKILILKYSSGHEKVTGTFEKRSPGPYLMEKNLDVWTVLHCICFISIRILIF